MNALANITNQFLFRHPTLASITSGLVTAKIADFSCQFFCGDNFFSFPQRLIISSVAFTFTTLKVLSLTGINFTELKIYLIMKCQFFLTSFWVQRLFGKPSTFSSPLTNFPVLNEKSLLATLRSFNINPESLDPESILKILHSLNINPESLDPESLDLNSLLANLQPPVSNDPAQHDVITVQSTPIPPPSNSTCSSPACSSYAVSSSFFGLKQTHDYTEEETQILEHIDTLTKQAVLDFDSNREKCWSSLQEAVESAQKMPERCILAVVYSNLSQMYIRAKNSEEAYKYAQLAYAHAKKTYRYEEDYETFVISCQTLSIFFKERGQFKESWEKLEEGDKIASSCLCRGHLIQHDMYNTILTELKSKERVSQTKIKLYEDKKNFLKAIAEWANVEDSCLKNIKNAVDEKAYGKACNAIKASTLRYNTQTPSYPIPMLLYLNIQIGNLHSNKEIKKTRLSYIQKAEALLEGKTDPLFLNKREEIALRSSLIQYYYGEKSYQKAIDHANQLPSEPFPFIIDCFSAGQEPTIFRADTAIPGCLLKDFYILKAAEGLKRNDLIKQTKKAILSYEEGIPVLPASSVRPATLAPDLGHTVLAARVNLSDVTSIQNIFNYAKTLS